MNKLWDKGFEVDGKIAAFTIGKDRELDLLLAPFDILGTIAHITMLESRGLLSRKELDRLLPELRGMYSVARAGNFVIGEGVEDVHSQVELDLTRILGDLGKKIHTGRSRNDQVAVDIRLFTRSAIERSKPCSMSCRKGAGSAGTSSCPAIHTCRSPCRRHSASGSELMLKALQTT